MKQMQGDRYKLARKVDLEIQHLEKGEAPMSPGKCVIHTCLLYLEAGSTAAQGMTLVGACEELSLSELVYGSFCEAELHSVTRSKEFYTAFQ